MVVEFPYLYHLLFINAIAALFRANMGHLFKPLVIFNIRLLRIHNIRYNILSQAYGLDIFVFYAIIRYVISQKKENQ